RELRTDEGGFAASQDADTEGDEGGTFVWTADEVRRELGPDEAVVFGAAYDVTDAGNWEGRTILRRVRTDDELATMTRTTPAEVADRLATARRTLVERRATRPQPARDDKVLAGWNGLALAAFADAIVALEATGARPAAERARGYRGLATGAAELLLQRLRRPDGLLGRSWKDGRASADGVLEDLAFLAEGLLALYGATFDERWFVAARGLADTILARFVDPDGGFFDTSDAHETLVVRPKDLQDNAVPSGNAMATIVLLELSALTGDGRYRTAAERALGLVAGVVGRYPSGFAQWLVALDFAHADVVELAIVGAPTDPATGRLLAAARTGYRPDLVVACAADPASSEIPLLEGRTQLAGRPTAFVCRQFACRQPVDVPEALAAQLVG
ncbi:MAG TPA: thioredoxin domain-containing protein, partial [Patescibacteria group bacterium]|nr:thioredoxin domain-containing protein [Patescibacteria group bacterium]